jgi:hypothetical protein
MALKSDSIYFIPPLPNTEETLRLHKVAEFSECAMLFNSLCRVRSPWNNPSIDVAFRPQGIYTGWYFHDDEEPVIEVIKERI